MAFTDININSFHISDMDTCIIQIMKAIGKDEKIDIFKEQLNIIDNINFNDEDFKDNII